MILKFKYHSESGLIEAFQSYTLAQNNSLSDTVIITSTASDASRFDYCLEFVCYNTKNIPKAQYISPILKYGDNGIEFCIPNALTEYRGHVDMQLTGIDPLDNTVVFKSISKNTKAFDVEGSLNVLENDLSETPNVFTEVLKKIDEMNNIKQDILNVVKDSMAEVSGDFFSGMNWYKVRFFVYDELVDEKLVVENTLITAPVNPSIPYGCATDGKWYRLDKDIEFDASVPVTENADYYYNFWHEGLSFDRDSIVGFTKGVNKIYFPEFYNGIRITSISPDAVIDNSNNYYLYISASFSDIINLGKFSGFYNVFVHPQNNYLTSIKYTAYDKDKSILLLYPVKLLTSQSLIYPSTQYIMSRAIVDTNKIQSLIIPSTLLGIDSYGIQNTAVRTLTLPKDMNMLRDYAIFNNTSLTDVYLEGDISDILTDFSICSQNGEGYTRPRLHIHIEYADKYLSKGLSYEFVIMEKEALDSMYVSK